MVYLAEYNIWSVQRKKVYRSKIADVDELKTRLIDEWAQFDQSIIDAAISQYRSLCAFVRVRGAHFEQKFWQFWIKLLHKLIILQNKPYKENIVFSSFMRQYLENGTRYDQSYY